MSRNPRADKNVDPAQQKKNEYIPNFIAKKPFYIDDLAGDADYLEHQRLQQDKTGTPTDKWYQRGVKRGPAATKYRKGACTNCGSMSHNAKECLSRPRKFGAKWTNQDIEADEVINEDLKLDYESKRDRWNGYAPEEHTQVVEEFQRLEELRNGGKADDEEDKYAEDAAAPGQGFDAADRISTRNLRIREDTAKYLVNLDLNSAKYDPKTRTMVAQDGEEITEAARLADEEEFRRSSGDAAEFLKAQRFAWETQERGDAQKIHLQANPTEAAVRQRIEEKQAAERAAAERKRLLEKYGGEQHLAMPELLQEDLGDTEQYVEYDERGERKDKPKPSGKSKYPEGVFINNHTSVWGSWWKDHVWGYACCHSTIKNSYCAGREGIEALGESDMFRTGRVLASREKLAIEDVPEDESAESRKRKHEGDDGAESVGKHSKLEA